MHYRAMTNGIMLISTLLSDSADRVEVMTLTHDRSAAFRGIDVGSLLTDTVSARPRCAVEN